MKYIDKETGNERKTMEEIEKNLFELKGNTSEFDDYDLNKFIAEFYIELPDLTDTEVISSTIYLTKTYSWKGKTLVVNIDEAEDSNLGSYELERTFDEDNSDSITEEEREEFMKLIEKVEE